MYFLLWALASQQRQVANGNVSDSFQTYNSDWISQIAEPFFLTGSDLSAISFGEHKSLVMEPTVCGGVTPFSLSLSTSSLLSKSFDNFVQSFIGPPLMSLTFDFHSIPVAEAVSVEELFIDGGSIPLENVCANTLGSTENLRKNSSMVYSCLWGDCPESFGTKSGLATHCKQHISLHLEGKKRKHRGYVCGWYRGACGAQFVSENTLAKHLSNADHVGQRPYKSKEELMAKKKFFCPRESCGKGFSDACSLKVTRGAPKRSFRNTRRPTRRTE